MEKKYLFFSLLGVLIAQLGFAQQKTITGRVVDEKGLPLPNATVIIENTPRGAAADFDGNFSIEAEEGEVIVVSYIGYTDGKITVGNADNYNVFLNPDSELEEVVVLGYSSKSKSEITGSVVQVGSDKIKNFPVTSADQILQGKVAGLSLIGTSGTPGSVQNILIRGRSSITASNRPLFVIDGVPVNNSSLEQNTGGSTFSPLANLNPEDIESITVLKDASSTAQYGARGTNGVIVITTKKGVITTKKGVFGAPQISVNSTIGFSNDAVNGPEMLTASEREMLFYEGIYNSHGAKKGFTRDQAEQFYREDPKSFGTQYVEWNEAGRPETRWQDVITNKNALYQNITISAGSGNEKSNYYSSFGYLNQEATVIGASLKRLSGTLNLNTKFSDKIQLDTRNSVSYAKQDGLLEQSAQFGSPRVAKYFFPPTAQPHNDDGSINITKLHSVLFNPLWIAENDINLSKAIRLRSNNKLHWDTPIENMTFNSTFSIDYNNLQDKQYNNRIHGDGENVNGRVIVSYISRANYVFQNALSYNYQIEKHKMDLKILQEFQKNISNTFSAAGEGFADDKINNLISAAKPTGVSGGYWDWKVGSYLGLLNYSFDSRYIFNASFRREGSSRFPAEGRWGSFWSLGLGWNVHQEQFMKNVDFIDNLKLRASFGLTGNSGIDLNTYQQSIALDSAYGGSPGIYLSAFGNQDLRWETAESFETGIDFTLFNNSVLGAFNYYHRETKDMLQSVPLSRTTGFANQNQNIGRMENKGIEIELSANIINRDDFHISLGGNLGTNRNRVLELAKDTKGEEINITTSTRRVETGHTVYEWYMVSYAGVDPDTGEALYYEDETLSTTTNKFGDAKRVFQGKGGIPTLLIGGNVHIDYKGFFLDADINYAGGHKVWESWTRYTNGSDRWATDDSNGINKLLNRWQKPGDITDVPKITHTLSPWMRHSRFLYEGDYIRLRNLTFGYKFKSALTKKLRIDSALIFVRGINLYTWVKDKGLEYDPEVTNGITGLTTPPVKRVILGINLKL